MPQPAVDRPAGEELIFMGVKVPEGDLRAFDTVAAELGVTRSVAVREAMKSYTTQKLT